MSDTADDLLDELEQLENASADMQEEVEKASEKNKALEASGNADHLDAAALSLEAARTAQLAAEQSQSAAEAAIKISHEQKAQVIELSDSNVAWRQSLRAASNDLKTAKNAITIMMSVSVTVSVISVGVMGWLYYSLNKKHENLKNDVLDIITTENTLFNKNLNLKVDQLSSLIEALAADIQRLNIPRSEGTSADLPKQTETSVDAKKEAAPAESPEASSAKPEAELAVSEPKADPTAMAPAISGDMVKDVQKDLKQYASERAEQYASIQTLLQKIQDVQAKIQASTLHKTSPSTVAPVKVTAMGLTESQVKKLNGISWSVSEQRKLLKKIQATLESQMKANSSKSKSNLSNNTGALKNIDSSLKQLSKQVTELKSQQDHIQKKVQDLETVTQELASRPNPYSYHAPELNIKE